MPASGLISGSPPNGSPANGNPANGSAANGSAANGSAANGSDGHPAGARPAGVRGAGSPETDQAAMILRAAGWRVATVDASTPLAAAWQQLSLPPAGPTAGRWTPDLAHAGRAAEGRDGSAPPPGGAPGERARWASPEAPEDVL
jgi:hypothetical protein